MLCGIQELVLGCNLNISTDRGVRFYSNFSIIIKKDHATKQTFSNLSCFFLFLPGELCGKKTKAR
jgi:hypothetical protein